MAQKDYIRLAALIDGKFQGEVTQLNLNAKSGDQPVETIAFGLSGKTPGSKSIEFSITAAVPVGGPEFDPFVHMAKGTYHEVQIAYGAKSLVSRGWFSEASISQSVNAATELSASFTGTFDDPK